MNSFHNFMRLFYIGIAERLIRLSNWHYAHVCRSDADACEERSAPFDVTVEYMGREKI